MEKLRGEQIIKLNIGGQIFETFKSTLTKYPNTMLGAMFTTSASLSNEKKEFFFDRDYKLFNHILNYYRNGLIDILKDIPFDTYLQELQFWGLPNPNAENIINLNRENFLDILKWNSIEKDISIQNNEKKENLKAITKQFNLIKKNLDSNFKNDMRTELIKKTKKELTSSINKELQQIENETKKNIITELESYNEYINSKISE